MTKFDRLMQAQTVAETSSSREYFLNDEQLPRVVEVDKDLDLSQWLKENKARLRTEISRYGALLFRGLDRASFEEVFAGLADHPVDYRGGAAIRSRVDSGTYTASEYPESLDIRLHSEFCYSNDWPMLLFFYCDVAPKDRGQTPIVDNRTLIRLIPEDIVRQFRERGLLYMRGYGYNRTWQRSYETESRAEVEELCTREGRSCEWLEDDRLRTFERRPAVAVHPVTGEDVWFNFAHGFHISRMDDDIRAALSTSAEDTDDALWPNNVYWGDGEEIDGDVIAQVNDIVDREAVQFDWAEGDVLVVDNMICGHGRRPYTGDRRILLKIADSYQERGTIGV
ncbi:TauD/TfdA family dioxygenase [Kitasatospora sp. MAP5-34]|uniref:TauD/TfdA family dioxygenase n=1 Tax=Kitasatospora sp. MAP5-34 TaxID=3035102 RepID=UPI002475CECE|nr:TauD/TfdA family dioxygenase [Kitasatospora sp. MAP5-34]MDH6578184.1 alpha-ketoglutarate-dependent taurine dioxygenase [Kitasatospora sp. MAP5-34]